MVFENWVKENKEEFLDKVEAIATYLGIKSDWLMAVMAFESNINPKAVNPISNATGLIQFMPNTAISLGTTISLLKQMSNVQQLDFVKKYLAPYRGKMNSLVDVYFAVFFPAAIGKSDTSILMTSSLSASKIASQNPIFDINKDGKITVGEVKTYFQNWVQRRSSSSISSIKKK